MSNGNIVRIVPSHVDPRMPLCDAKRCAQSAVMVCLGKDCGVGYCGEKCRKQEEQLHGTVYYLCITTLIKALCRSSLHCQESWRFVGAVLFQAVYDVAHQEAAPEHQEEVCQKPAQEPAQEPGFFFSPERDRERDRERDIERQRETDRETETERDRERDRERDIERDRERQRQR